MKATQDKDGLPQQVGQLVMDKLAQEPPDAVVVASGTSCRQQIAQLSARRPLHFAEVLASDLGFTAEA